MSYAAFTPCTIVVDGQSRRAVKSICGKCQAAQELPFNTTRRSGGDDAEVLERLVARKFEAHGWKAGKHPKDNRCPQCNATEKAAMASKVVSITNEVKQEAMASASTAALDINHANSMTRDKRRIITSKLEEVHYGNDGGYTDDWSDEKLSNELNVPRAWIAKVREDYFGTDTNEYSSWMEMATKLLAGIKAEHAEFCKKADDLMATAITLETTLKARKW